MDRTLISILSGLGGMFGWGTSDFLANNVSEKIGHTKAFFWSQIAGLVLIVVMVAFIAPSFAMSPLLFGLSVFGGIAYALGYLLFYKGFEIGNVSVVSAVINFQVLFIVIISFLRGQPLSFLQIPAIVLIILGVSLVSVNFNDLKKGSVSLFKGVKETLLATVMFGVFYEPLHEFVVERADWLVVSLIVKFIAILFVFVTTYFGKKSLIILKPSNKFIALIASVGLLEAVGVLSISFGLSYGDGIIVAPISSALTVVTVGLAMVFLKEKISKIQAFGIIIVVLGIIMTAV